jgi:hypothetical protein
MYNFWVFKVYKLHNIDTIFFNVLVNLLVRNIRNRFIV